MGFRKGHQLKGKDGKLQFASVEKDGIELMYQTRRSVLEERPNSAPELTGHSTALYFTVEKLDTLEKALAKAPLVKARHKTAYGSQEIYVREPGGKVVGFAQFGD